MLLKSIWKILRPRGALTLHIPGDLPSLPQDTTENALPTTKSEIVELFQNELGKRRSHPHVQKTRESLHLVASGENGGSAT